MCFEDHCLAGMEAVSSSFPSHTGDIYTKKSLFSTYVDTTSFLLIEQATAQTGIISITYPKQKTKADQVVSAEEERTPNSRKQRKQRLLRSATAHALSVEPLKKG